MFFGEKNITWTSIKLTLWYILVKRIQGTIVYPFFYRSFWNYLFCSNRQGDFGGLYYSARPNPWAGIGHQMANWISGYWWAKQFGLRYAHLPFSTKEWDDFLGFGYDEKTVEELKKNGYKVRKLPRFRETNIDEICLQKKIISSYSGEKVVFVAEQDQGYKNQYGVMEDIQRKFYNAPSRKCDHFIFDKNHFNIAIHVRRGDILKDPSNPNLKMRYLSNDYFFRVLLQVLDWVKTEKEIHIYFFSQGIPEDFPEFKIFKNLHWCFDMRAQQSFLHMVYADLLITSKSSFSYKPALLSKGIKVCPINFWHGYPKTKEWVLCEDDGTIIYDILYE